MVLNKTKSENVKRVLLKVWSLTKTLDIEQMYTIQW